MLAMVSLIGLVVGSSFGSDYPDLGRIDCLKWQLYRQSALEHDSQSVEQSVSMFELVTVFRDLSISYQCNRYPGDGVEMIGQRRQTTTQRIASLSIIRSYRATRKLLSIW
jgi:hypothetical protein